MADDFTELNKYEPTPSELKLIEILCNPDYATKSITQICKSADVTRPTYYNAIKKDGFNELIKQTSIDLVKSSLAKIVNATINYAINSPNNSSDRKVLLQMADMLVEKTENRNIDIQLSNEEMEMEIKEYYKNHPEEYKKLVE